MIISFAQAQARAPAGTHGGKTFWLINFWF